MTEKRGLRKKDAEGEKVRGRVAYRIISGETVIDFEEILDVFKEKNHRILLQWNQDFYSFSNGLI